jgi:imidazolonepropionase-like amidohydrolase
MLLFLGISETLKKDCSILLEGEKIKEIKEQDKSVYENCDVIDIGGRVLMPGFIDLPYAFPVMRGSRTFYADE